MCINRVSSSHSFIYYIVLPIFFKKSYPISKPFLNTAHSYSVCTSTCPTTLLYLTSPTNIPPKKNTMLFTPQLLLSLSLSLLLATQHVAAKPPQCPESNPGVPVFLPDPEDCHVFYECINGGSFAANCGPGGHFDAQAGSCVPGDCAK